MNADEPLIAIIPAKARSTRFPGKNTAMLAGKPLLCWTIEAALQSKLFTTVMVSTDNEDIANLSRNTGAEVPFIRPTELCRDTVEVGAVVRHALEWYRDQRKNNFNWVCVLQTTSPLRTAAHIRDSWDITQQNRQVSSIISVTKYHHHPGWALKVVDQKVIPVDRSTASASRQHLPDLYHPDGVIYWQRAADVLNGAGTYDGVILPYFTPADVSLDIDYPEDLLFAEWIIRQRQRSSDSRK